MRTDPFEGTHGQPIVVHFTWDIIIKLDDAHLETRADKLMSSSPPGKSGYAPISNFTAWHLVACTFVFTLITAEINYKATSGLSMLQFSRYFLMLLCWCLEVQSSDFVRCVNLNDVV